jgi:hypothetical protein
MRVSGEGSDIKGTGSLPLIRLLKNAHLLRCVSPCVVQRTPNVRLTTQVLRALHLDIFEQPEKINKNVVIGVAVA